MTRAELVALLRDLKFAVEATVHDDGRPQAATIGVAVTDELELVFDTVMTTRKWANLRRDPRIALTWWRRDLTVQLEGVADEPTGDELERLRACYVAAFPGGVARAAWPTIAYFRVRPTWIRVSDFAQDPPVIELVAA